jgi:uncharacterized protein YutE (UPF0331/DUF86 family)
MNATENPHKAYVYALREQVEQHIAGLNELSELRAKRALTFNERNSVERSLQVITEAAIGCSKHLLKALGKPVPSESRAAIWGAYDVLKMHDPDISVLRGAVGMRNAIIHDYLNLDWNRIDPVLLERKYLLVQQFVVQVTDRLLATHKDSR